MLLPAGNRKQLRLLLPVLVVVVVVLGLKVLAHRMGWEVISLSPLFSGIIAATVFLMGFLLAGVLADYKESERLPGELASSLETMVAEARAIHKIRQAPAAEGCLTHLLNLTVSIIDWFYEKQHMRDVVSRLYALDDYFSAFESLIPANYIVRLKQEQSNVRRMLTRAQTIRETRFVSSAYLVARATTVLLVLGLILAQIATFLESLFFTGVITFVLVFLDLLIHDLDNPFGYQERRSSEDVSLKPLHDLLDDLRTISAATGDIGTSCEPPPPRGETSASGR
jgi:predicted membrane chloride channel (bestrophin family)